MSPPEKSLLSRILGVGKNKSIGPGDQEHRDQLHVILSSIGDAVVSTDIQGRVEFMNGVAQRLTGWTTEEAQGLPLNQVFRIVNEQTRQTVENPALRSMNESGSISLPRETLLISKTGNEIPIEDSAAPVKDETGKTIGSVLIFRDISDRRRDEHARTLLSYIVQSSDDAIIGKNLDGIITSWNSGAERMFGWTASEAIGNSITIIIPHDRLDEEKSILQRLRRGERIDHFDTIRISKDGRLMDISLTVSPIQDSTGRVIGASKIARDVTERKRSEEALAQQREWLQVTLSSIGDAVIATDTEGNISFINKVAQRLTGYTEDESRGKPLRDIFHIVNEQTRNPVENPALLALREGRIVSLANHTVLIAKNGLEFLIDDSGAPIRVPGGNILGSVLVFRDITEKRFAEEKFRLAVEAAPNSVVMTDHEGRIILVNSQTERLFGYSRDELIGNPIEILVPPRYRNDHPVFRSGFASQPVSRPMGTGRDLFGLRKDGSEIPIEIGLNPIFSKGQLLILSSIVDITARKQAETERTLLLEREQAARADAEAANRTKDEFLATVSHELRTPLNAILGWVRLLSTGTLDGGSVKRAIETIEQSARAQARLIDDLLDVSRITSGKMRLNFEPVDLMEVIQNALQTMRPVAQAKSIRLETKFNPAATKIVGDATRLQQIVWNLLSNAVKFTSQGGCVEIELDHSGNHAEIKVKDTGIGISAEFLPHLFEPFRQADGRDTRRHGGLGLGLSIVRHLVEMHGGTVMAQSEGEGRGSVFIVRMPLMVMQAQPRTQTDQLFADKMPDLNRVRALVVDDDESAREVVSAVLKQCGAQVATVSSADEALTALTQWHPNVLVSDIAMPGENGYQLITKVRSLKPEQGGNIPAVALTAYAKTEDRMRALAAGFQSHIAKPVEPGELALVVASLLHLDK